MDIKEKAKKFAIRAHYNQVRKSEPDKPMIIHPMEVAKMLEEYGFDENVVSAACLHDVVEDTSYTIEDIEREFGEDIAQLVYSVSEPDKSLPWKERKQHTIDTIKNMDCRKKIIACADKINNLESLAILFSKNRKKRFFLFQC